jgi:uncharacterized protein with PQ loop repeat
MSTTTLEEMKTDAAPAKAGHAIEVPSESAFALWFTRFMYLPAIGGNFVPLIQAMRILIYKDSGQVSPIAWSFALFCLACWLVYGIVKHDKVLIWANIVGVINASILIACIVIYS